MPVKGIDSNHLYKAVKNNPDEKKLILAAVKIRGDVLEYASDRLQADEEVVTAAVKQNGHALLYAAHKIKSQNKKIVLAAIKENPMAFFEAKFPIQKDEEIIQRAVQGSRGFFWYLSDDLKKDKDIIGIAFKQMRYLDSDYQIQCKTIQDIYRTAISKNTKVLMYAQDNLKNDKNIVFASLNKMRLLSSHSIDKYEPNSVKTMWLEAFDKRNKILEKEKQQSPQEKIDFSQCSKAEERLVMLRKYLEHEKTKKHMPYIPDDLEKFAPKIILEDQLIKAVSSKCNTDTEAQTVVQYLKSKEAYKKETQENPQYRQYFELSTEDFLQIIAERDEQLAQQNKQLEIQAKQIADQTDIILGYEQMLNKDHTTLLGFEAESSIEKAFIQND